jgi:Tfp pilus assembly protein PilX
MAEKRGTKMNNGRLQSGRRVGRRAGSSTGSREGGAVLVVGLLMLVVVTLLSLAAMQSVGLQERMAGNAMQNARLFQAAETALRFAENSLADRRSPNLDQGPDGFIKIDEDFATSPGVVGAAAPDLNELAGWVSKKTLEFDPDPNLRLVSGIDPWLIVEKLPNVTSDVSLRVQNKRDMEVFRVNVLTSNATPSDADDEATTIVILQSILMRH